MANAHLVFYDEERFHEFRGQDPERPDAGNEFQPFLSCQALNHLAFSGSRGLIFQPPQGAVFFWETKRKTTLLRLP